MPEKILVITPGKIPSDMKCHKVTYEMIFHDMVGNRKAIKNYGTKDRKMWCAVTSRRSKIQIASGKAVLLSRTREAKFKSPLEKAVLCAVYELIHILLISSNL